MRGSILLDSTEGSYQVNPFRQWSTYAKCIERRRMKFTLKLPLSRVNLHLIKSSYKLVQLLFYVEDNGLGTEGERERPLSANELAYGVNL